MLAARRRAARDGSLSGNPRRGSGPALVLRPGRVAGYRVTPLTLALTLPPGAPSIIAEAVRLRPMSGRLARAKGSEPACGSFIAVIRKRCRPRFRDGRAVARIASSSKTLWTESFAISVSPEVRYCVGTGTACWYGADNGRLDQGEPERIVVLDRSY